MQGLLHSSYDSYHRFLDLLVREKPKIKKQFGADWYEGYLNEIDEIEGGGKKKDRAKKTLLGFNVVYQDNDSEDLDERTFIECLRLVNPNRAKELKEKSEEVQKTLDQMGQWKQKRHRANGERTVKLNRLSAQIKHLLERLTKTEAAPLKILENEIRDCLRTEVRLLSSQFRQVPYPPHPSSNRSPSNQDDANMKDVNMENVEDVRIPKAKARNASRPASSSSSSSSSGSASHRVENNGNEDRAEDVHLSDDEERCEEYVIENLLRYDIRDGEEKVKVRWKVSRRHYIR